MTQWKQGESGNPAGRPRGAFPLSKALRDALQANGGEALREIVGKIIEKAKAGEPNALKMVMDRVDGPAVGYRERVADEVMLQFRTGDIRKLEEGGIL